MKTLHTFILLLAVGIAQAAEQRFVPYNPLTGATLGGIVYTNGTFTGNGSGLTNTWNTVSVTDFGAIGTDTNLDTTAFQAAVNSGATTILVPPGTYVLDSVSLADNVALVGIGRPTLRLRYAGAPYYMLDAHLKTNVTIRGFTLNGMGLTNMSAAVTVGGGAAIWIKGTGFGNTVSDVFIQGFLYGGIIVYAGDETGRGMGLIVDNVRVRNCYFGCLVGAGADYVRINNSAFSFCAVGLETDVGNTAITGCEANNNGVGLMVGGPGNNSHGSWLGGALNHNTWALYATNAGLGFEISGVNLWQGKFMLLSSTNISVSGNFGSIIDIYSTNCGPCWVSGSYNPNDRASILVYGGENLSVDVRTTNSPNSGIFGRIAARSVSVTNTLTASNFVSTAANVTTPAFKSGVTNNFILKADDGGTWILRVGNDGTLTTVTNTSGL